MATTIINSTSIPAIADTINKNSLIGDVFNETAETSTEKSVEAAAEIVEGTIAEETKVSLEIKKGTLHGMPVHYMGDLEYLLNKTRVTIAMSAFPTNRDGKRIDGGPTKEQQDFSRAAASWFVKETGAAILSGGLRDVDVIPVMAAISSESETYGKGLVGVVVPLGINTLLKTFSENDKKSMQEYIQNRQLVIISTSEDDDMGWARADAKPRNKLLVKMSDAILVPHVASNYHQGTDTFSGGVMGLLEYAEAMNVPVGIRAWKRGEHPIMLNIPQIFPENTVVLPRGKAIERLSDLIG